MKLKIFKEHLGGYSGDELYQRYYYGNYGELLITLTEVGSEYGKGYRYILGYEDSLDTKVVGPTTSVTDQPVFHTVKDFWVEDTTKAQKEFDKLCMELKKEFNARDKEEDIAYWDKYYGRKTESLLTEDLDSSYNYYKDKIDRKTFDKLVRLDPTFNEDKNKMGTYGKWILARYVAGTDVKTNQGHVKDCLTRFEDAKKNLDKKDIMQYKSLAEIDAALSDDSNYNDIGHNAVAKNDHIWGNDLCDVYTPSTFESAQKIGLPCAWCTSNDQYYYDYYKRRYGGEYYIILPKKASHNDEKYQFHFESNQFMNVHDNPCNIAHVVEKFHLYDCPQMVQSAQKYVDENYEDKTQYKSRYIWDCPTEKNVATIAKAFHLNIDYEIDTERQAQLRVAIEKMIRGDRREYWERPATFASVEIVCLANDLNSEYDRLCKHFVDTGIWYWTTSGDDLGVLLRWAEEHNCDQTIWDNIAKQFNRYFYDSNIDDVTWLQDEYPDKMDKVLQDAGLSEERVTEDAITKGTSEYDVGDALIDRANGTDFGALDEVFRDGAYNGMPNELPTRYPNWFLPHIANLGLTQEQFTQISKNDLDVEDENGDPVDADVKDIRRNMENAYADGTAIASANECWNDFVKSIPGTVEEKEDGLYTTLDIADVFNNWIEDDSDGTFWEYIECYIEGQIEENFREPYLGWWEFPDDDTYFEILADML